MDSLVTHICLLMSLLISLAMCGCKDDCLCRDEVGSLKCDCSSPDFTCAVSHVKDGITSLQFTTIEETKTPIYLNNANLSRFSNLTHLSIATSIPEQEIWFSYVFGLDQCNTFQGLEHLKALQLNLLIDYSTATLHKMIFAPLLSLEELDLSYTQVLRFPQLRESFSGMGTQFLKKLLLRNVQSHTSNPGFTTVLNLTWFLEPLEKMPLEILDFSRNTLLRVIPGLLRHKRLKEVYFHENFIQVTNFFLEMFIHPSLEMTIGDCQGCPTNKAYKLKFFSDWVELLDNMTDHALLPADSLVLQKDSPISRFVDADQMTTGKNPEGSSTESPSTGYLTCRFLSSGILGRFPYFKDVNCNDFPDFSLERAESPCIYGIRLPIGPNLRELSWAHLGFYQGGYGDPKNGTYCFSSLNNLRFANLANLGKWGTLFADSINDCLFRGLTKVEVISLENSELKLRNTQFFSGFPNLRVLNMRGNRVYLENDTNAQFFANNKQLQILNLSNCGLSLIPRETFSHLGRLQVLDLSENKITHMSFALPMTGHIQKLFLQKNNIQTLSLELRKQFDKIATFSRVVVDLSDNSLSCACRDADFIKWMQTTRVGFIKSESYQCQGAQSGINLITNIDLEKLDSFCNPSYVAVICASVLSTLSVVGVILVGVSLYRQRFSIMHWKYVRFTRPKLAFDEDSSFKYDAFIVYNSDDKWWTHHVLLAEIEDKRQMKLCIYLRDFPAGGAYADVIDDVMKQSRKTVLILSPKFFASNWCLHEMSMVHNKLVAEGIDLTELVILSPLSSDVMTSTLTQLMQNKPTLNWTEDPDGQKLFWDKLEDAIRSPRLFPNLS